MLRVLRSGIGSSLLVTAFLLGAPKEASACSPPQSGWWPGWFSPAPANGVVVLTYTCAVECGTPPAVESLSLKDEAGEAIPGSVVFSETAGSQLRIAFRPEPEALTEGGVYTAELEGVSPFSGLLVGPALTFDDALTPSVEVFEVDHPAGEARCCPGPLDSCGNTPCFRTEVERRTTVGVDWQEVPAIELDQYVFRLGRDAVDPVMPWSWGAGDIRFELDETEDGACFVLELRRLVDDSLQTFASHCVGRPPSFTPGLHPTPEADLAEVLRACDEPPAGYDRAWCEARKELCVTSPDEPWCAEFVERCAVTGTAGAGGEANGAGAPGHGGDGSGLSGTGGTGGSGSNLSGTSGDGSSTSGNGGTAAGGDDGEAGETSNAGDGGRVYTKGCGCGVPGDSSRKPAALLFVLGLVTLRRRRGRSGGSPTT